MNSLINRISSGFIFQDTFDATLLHERWQVSPSNNARYSLTEKPGFLRLKHGDPDLFILMNAPRTDFVIEVDTNYDPVELSDKGGIVAFRDNKTAVSMLEYYDDKMGTAYGFNNLRMVRHADLFEGYGSNNNGKTWEFVGASALDAPKIGVTLQGIQESGSDTLDISEIRMYRDTSVHVGNLNPGQTVKLVDSANAIVGSATCEPDHDYVKVNVQNIKFPLTAKVQLYDKTNFLLDETALHTDIWGGDVFWYGVTLDFELDGLLLRQDREYQLGNMENGSIERRGAIINNNDIPIHNVRASVAALSEYRGWEWVDIASDVFGLPGVYADSIELGTIHPGESIPIWIKIVRQPNQQIASLHDYKFRITFESG